MASSPPPDRPRRPEAAPRPQPAARAAPRLPRRAAASPTAVDALVRRAAALRRDPLRLRLAGALVVALCGALLVAAAGLADGHFHRGVEAGATDPPTRQLTGRDLAANGDLSRFSPDQLPTVAAALQANGIRYLRQTFAWSDLEPEPGVFHWERADAVVDELNRRGIAPVAVLQRSPGWARDPAAAASFDAPPADPGTYEAFVRQFVGRYGERVPFVQIWDAPNRADHWGGTPADPAAYLTLLARGFNGARSANPNVSVVLAELDPAPGGGGLGDLAFLDELYRVGAAPFFNVVAARVDGGTRSPYDRGRSADAPSLSRATLVRALMLRNGDGQKPVWATHYGWRATTDGSTPPGVNPADQAAFAVAGIERARAEWPWMGLMFAWGLAPGPSLGGTVDPDEALLRADGSSTPLLAALGAFAASGGTDAAPTGFLPVQARQFLFEGNWELQHLGDATYRTTSQTGARLSVRFVGTGATARLRLGQQAGDLDVTLDGRPIALDLDAFQTADVDIRLATGLPDTVHTLTMQLRSPGQFTIGGLVVERAVPLRWPVALLLGGGLALLAAGFRNVLFALAERAGWLRRREPGEWVPELPLLPGWRPSRNA